MGLKPIGAAVSIFAIVASVPAAAQGFSGSGAAGYAQSQGWTASPGTRMRGSDPNAPPMPHAHPGMAPGRAAGASGSGRDDKAEPAPSQR